MINNIKLGMKLLLFFTLVFSGLLKGVIAIPTENLLEQLKPNLIPSLQSKYPFSFYYRDTSSEKLLAEWPAKQITQKLDENRTKQTVTWNSPDGLQVICEFMLYTDYPDACEWLLSFENLSKQNSGIIRDIQTLDLKFRSPISSQTPYRLHKTVGGCSDATEFAASEVVITKEAQEKESMGGASGFSSYMHFPFFKIDTGQGSLITAIGWSGQWAAQVSSPDNSQLLLTAGMEKTHFLLYPAEKVRSPRILLFYWKGDSLESNAQFRQLIYKHYVPLLDEKKPLPTVHCLDVWVREMEGEHPANWYAYNTENQSDMIKSFSLINPDAYIQDATWFEGCFNDLYKDIGSWNIRKKSYPQGLAPMAEVAKSKNMKYGVWFEPERAMVGTDTAVKHPEWTLGSPEIQGVNTPEDWLWGGYLVNFGIQEVQDYFFGLVDSFMKSSKGFRVYRQDSNFYDQLISWREKEAPDRQGINEIKHISGMYTYWERIASAWPDSFRDQVAAGGRRIDLETVMRMHVHQKSDYLYYNETDQSALWGLSQYLPNNTFFGYASTRLDDYSFHSLMAASMSLGWDPATPGYDLKQAQKLRERHRSIRHLLVGAWYPLLPFAGSERTDAWLASQYHRPDLDEGMILFFRREKAQNKTKRVSLRGLEKNAKYTLRYWVNEKEQQTTGDALMNNFELTLPTGPSTELITYKRN